VDICQNSEFVKKYRTAVMEKTCYRLWDFLYSLPVINLQPDKPIREAICLRIALDSGPVKFSDDTGRIVSEVINDAAHLEKKGTSPGALSVSDEVFAGLPATLKAVFTAKPGARVANRVLNRLSSSIEGNPSLSACVIPAGKSARTISWEPRGRARNSRSDFML
jgi:hypothetical protein